MYMDHGELKNFKGEIFKGRKEIQNFYTSPMPKGFKLTIRILKVMIQNVLLQFQLLGMVYQTQ